MDLPERTVLPLRIDHLSACCAWWQEVLRLRDWEIKLEIARMSDLDAGTLGDCTVSRWKRQACIRLLDHRDVEGQRFRFDGDAWDWEITLVHELLHLQFNEKDLGLDVGDNPQWLALERAIDVMAKALLKLGRWPGHV